MGLRMFEEPGVTESKAAARLDPTIDARSPIRRQRTIRYGPGIRPRYQSPSSHPRHRPNQASGLSAQTSERRTLLEDIRRSGRNNNNQLALEPLRNGISDLRMVGEDRSRQREQVVAATNRGQPTHLSRAEIGGFTRPDPRLDEPVQPSREPDILRYRGPAPVELTSFTFDALRPPPTTSHSPMLQRRGDARSTFSNPASDDTSPSPLTAGSIAEYTPGFAPAHRLNRIDPSLRYSERMVDIASLANQVRYLRTLSTLSNTPSQLDAMLSDLNNMMLRNESELSYEYLVTETDCLDTMRSELERTRSRALRMLDAPEPYHHHSGGTPELQRARRLELSSSLRHDDTDGLGDRARSRSHSPDAVSWETMLTTIPPDDQVPSASSSFDSANASASVGSPRSSSVVSRSTAPSSTAEIEPCPAIDTNSSDGEDQVVGMSESRFRSSDLVSGEFLNRANRHLDRIESLSGRLRQQRAQGEVGVRNHRVVERAANLQQLETTLQRLQRLRQSLEEERQSSAMLARHNGVRAERERL